jgi:hypothetical protein
MCTTVNTARIDTIFKFFLQARIIAAVKKIDEPTLARVWNELKYRIEGCRVTRGAHIELLQLSKQNVFSVPVAMNNSMKVSSLVFLLFMFVIKENIMKRPVLLAVK